MVYTNSTITQSDIVKYVKGDTRNHTGQPEEIVDAVRYASKNTKFPELISGHLSYSEAVKKIDENHPFVISIKATVGGHAIVCAGYDKLHSSVRIIDPEGEQKKHNIIHIMTLFTHFSWEKHIRQMRFNDYLLKEKNKMSRKF